MSEPPPTPVQPAAGGPIVAVSWAATAVFAVTATLAVVFEGAPRTIAAAVSLVFFGLGCVLFLVAFAVGVGRSRTEQVGLGGLFFLAGTAPAEVRRSLRTAVLAQTVIALVTASLRVYTSLAFGILVPLLGLGLMGLWGARNGTFFPNDETAER